MTLTEFLTARFKEDEEPTWTLHPYDCPPDCCAPAGWVGSQCRYCDVTPMYGGTVKAMTQSAEEHAETIHQRSRVLAECDAKRGAIEAAWMDHCRIEGEWGTGKSREQMEAAGDYPEVVQWLALPYAHHPDYRPEWAP